MNCINKELVVKDNFNSYAFVFLLPARSLAAHLFRRELVGNEQHNIRGFKNSLKLVSVLYALLRVDINQSKYIGLRHFESLNERHLLLDKVVHSLVLLFELQLAELLVDVLLQPFK